MKVGGVYLKASNGIGGDGGVSTTHMGRGVDVVERCGENIGFFI